MVEMSSASTQELGVISCAPPLPGPSTVPSMRAIVCCSLIFFDPNLQVYFSGQPYFPSPTPLPLMVVLLPIPASARMHGLCHQEEPIGRPEGPHQQGATARVRGRTKRPPLTLHPSPPDQFRGQVDLQLSNPTSRDEKSKISTIWYGIWQNVGLSSNCGGKVAFSSNLMSKMIRSIDVLLKHMRPP